LLVPRRGLRQGQLGGRCKSITRHLPYKRDCRCPRTIEIGEWRSRLDLLLRTNSDEDRWANGLCPDHGEALANLGLDAANMPTSRTAVSDRPFAPSHRARSGRRHRLRCTSRPTTVISSSTPARLMTRRIRAGRNGPSPGRTGHPSMSARISWLRPRRDDSRRKASGLGPSFSPTSGAGSRGSMSIMSWLKCSDALVSVSSRRPWPTLPNSRPPSRSISTITMSIQSPSFGPPLPFPSSKKFAEGAKR